MIWPNVVNIFTVILKYCAISFNSAGPVTRDGPAEIFGFGTLPKLPKFWEVFGSLAPQATKNFYIQHVFAK
jgi:hypothetical protein